MRQAYLPLGPPTVFLSLVLICVLVGRAAVLRGDGVAAAVRLRRHRRHGLRSSTTCLLAFDLVVDRRILVSRLSYSALLVAIGIGLTWRFAKALNEVDSFAGRLVTLVREAEDKLRASLALEEEQRARGGARDRTQPADARPA